LFASPSLDFMYISASAPEAPPLSDTTIGCFIRLFFWIGGLHHPRHLIGSAAGAGRDHDFDRLGRLQAIAGALASTAASAARL